MSVLDNERAIVERAGFKLDRMRTVEVPEIMQQRSTTKRKIIRLREVADRAINLVSPNTPCKKGCTYCCYQAVPVSLRHAQLISEKVGVPHKSLDYEPTLKNPESTDKRLKDNIYKYMRTPCPFLGVEGECTIYDVRPMPCRLHHVIEMTPERCDLFTGVDDSRCTDLGWIQLAETMVDMQEQSSLADIREWFPEPVYSLGRQK